MTLTKRTRYEVLRRDDYTCRYCRSTDGKLTVDHVVPVALGGTDDPSNLVAACSDCNAGKSSASPDASLVAQVSDDAVRWSAAMQQAAQWAAAELEAEEDYERSFLGVWTRHAPRGYEGSLAAMRRAGLPLADLLYAARVAQDARGVDDRWRYFCGVAWKRLGQIQDKAKQILDHQPADGGGGAQCKFCLEAVEIDRDDYETDEDYRQAHVDVHCSQCDFVFFEGFQQARAHYEVTP